ncbi:TetR/AcrR family transcriptional regulator [Zavarzinia compransoris]|uniref:TetR/AcrR family transcriptional regulator n=1 Tax=Zavarzinia compransoris TaxID=1264899 RepID=A0A317E3F9_9PROT|nr:TetR/AcrR family transcriptional regulator [Zavarzinia compransoris]PWR21638.1 TetR/AcrR family transcriptional regulator [Zavarzinia compransoris]TDP45582.1 TetR family transcriptional regulator [Zavarzinia compransoris]
MSRRQAKPATSPHADSGNRLDIIIDAAAHSFAKAGYDATTMRDIAALTGILPGSIYYHFKSKEDLFLAVHDAAIERVCRGVLRAIKPGTEPWTRLEQAATGYLDSMLGADAVYATLIVTEFPKRRSRKLRSALVSHRDRFERLFTGIIDELPLRESVDRRYWRLALMGMLAWTHVWYRAGTDSPQAIACKLVEQLRFQTAQ